MKNEAVILVSSCLCGETCKYNGGHNWNEAVNLYCQGKKIVRVCPEVLGGLSVPRSPSEIVGGTAKDVLVGRAKVMTKQGNDVTKAFLQGANLTLKVAQEKRIKFAILKANSPSCGKGKVYNGKFNGNLILGNGITTECLLKAGISVMTEYDIEQKKKL